MANPTVAAVASEGLQFYNTLIAQQQKEFGDNQAALATISKAWAPVLSSGQVPYGYSPQLDQLLQANVIQTGSQAEANAMNAEDLRMKQEAGGAQVLPTGAQEQLRADILAKGQQEIAGGLQREKIAGYQQGLANLEGGTKAELGIAEATDPSRAAGATTGAGGLAEQAGAEQFKENQQGSMFSKVMGGISTIAGAAKDVFGGGAGSAAAGMGL